ncbi:PREDICTED: calmodulin-binding transcription activator 2-like [Tarenaya hassleriana]|uniref:calmodulin-binding transcription activator 2-like n=1 Tax=Tarenaya hassleriana TaxID=28532 RepID=UPI00053C6819|nr:PREDICTED: calmodulin-binding transcription activator 2-like [Tarenaya hassleriana]
MADRGSFGFGPRLDIEQLLSEAQHRWLRPSEICEILRNYQKFHIASEPPNRPPSGSLFLFDRKVLRYFRKDGHNWRKKKDGKTIKEAHEKLKVGSVDMLHCYYAHGEDNSNFQRRSYWMLEQDFMHIVFVHYLEVKGNRMSTGGIKENNSNSVNDTTSVHIGSTASPTSTLSSLCEDADSGDIHRASSSMQALSDPKIVTQIGDTQDASILNSYYMSSFSGTREGWMSAPGAGVISQIRDSQGSVGVPVWRAAFEDSTTNYHNLPCNDLLSQMPPSTTGLMLVPGMENAGQGGLIAADNDNKEHLRNPLQNQVNWQIPGQDNLPLPKWPMDLVSLAGMGDGTDLTVFEQRAHNSFETFSSLLDTQRQQSIGNGIQFPLTSVESDYIPKLNPDDLQHETSTSLMLPRKSLLSKEDSLKKVDSFSRWVSKELGEMEDLKMQSSGGIAWTTVECETAAAGSSLSPSLPQDQRFTIIDFWPKWGHIDSEVEVMVIGTFLMSKQEVTRYNWSCMFGEVEVPAEILVDGVLCCHAPPHTVGQVPFYVTCSDRFACSEVREFDFLPGFTKKLNATAVYGATTSEASLYTRFERLLAHRSPAHEHHIFEGVGEKRKKISKIMLIKDETESLLPGTTQKDSTEQEAKGRVIRDLFEEKIYIWLIHKVTEDGKGPNILDEEGQGVLHFAAALGYDWAIKPILAAGVSINFRDANGWTALHWAAFSGREQTVAVLVSLGADAGASTDPSPEFPLGKTAADLGSGNGHKGISGFLAESSLTSYLEQLKMNESKENSSADSCGAKVVQTVSERTATPMSYGDVPEALCLKDSLTAVCNATQAADRIHQVFRMQSFQRKQLSQFAGDESDISDELAVSFAAAKTGKPGHSEGVVHAAAVHIQKKYRGWKKRKEFILIRQRIVKIQAHVRGHQVRKQYRAIIWSVGILEKIILRWRRKGSGLRGFRREGGANAAKQAKPGTSLTQKEDDEYDFLKEGKKQTEERLKKALTRVKSMVQYPEARAQYRRLLTVVEGFRVTEEASNSGANSNSNNNNNNAEEGDGEGKADDDYLLDIDSLLDDDTFMSIAFE